jgi:putative protease
MTTRSVFPETKALPELLAPAGSPAAFRAAVAAGADAVYLSGRRFGARRFAPNFSDDEIREAIVFAHSRDVRVYVTINTLIHDYELAGVADYLAWLYSIGADAVLVQDLGVVAMAREIAPGLSLHASTQMTLHNAAGVAWAAAQGFSRVVLARELSLRDVEDIAARVRGTGIGLEVFAHGALCYCYSGQCLLSSVIGGRSGNRGMCAQPCRKPYVLVHGSRDAYGRPVNLRDHPSPDRYLLSPKDLCTYPHLADLVRAPVVSLKIEGRMKSPEYVAIVVSTYRRALDAIAAGTRTVLPLAYQDLLLAFNRGFSPGYLFGARGDTLMGRDAPDNRGICIGTVTRSDKRSGTVYVKTSGSLIPRPGDGILFSDPEDPGNEFGFALNTVPVARTGEIIFTLPRTAGPGTRVYITSSRDLEARAKQIITHPPPDLHSLVPIDVSIRVDPAGCLVLEGTIHARSGNEIVFSYVPDLCLEPARSRPLSREMLEQQLKKTGGTQFVIRNFSLIYDGDMFAPIASLNSLRRAFLCRADEVLVSSFLPQPEDTSLANDRLQSIKKELSRDMALATGRRSLFSLNLCVYADSLDLVRSAVGSGCDSICFEPAWPEQDPRGSDRVTSLRTLVIAAFEICRDAKVNFVWKFSRITGTAFLDAILPEVRDIISTGVSHFMVDNPGAAEALCSIGPGPVLSGSAGLNIFNHRTARLLSGRFRLLTLSPELTRDDIMIMVHAARAGGTLTEFALIVQGNSEAMVSEDCVSGLPEHGVVPERGTLLLEFIGIKDSTGHVFPVHIDSECRTHVLNASELCLVDYLPSIMHAGIGEVVLDARGRTEAYAVEIVGIYREAIELTKQGVNDRDGNLNRLKHRIKAVSLGGITTGHFLRGLKDS